MINGAIDEWIDDIQCGDRLRHGFLWEEDENFEELQVDKFANEFIFNLFKFISLGGQMCQFETKISEFLDCTKDLYKDLVAVGKDPTTQEIKPRSIIFRIDNVKAPSGAKAEFGDHP